MEKPEQADTDAAPPGATVTVASDDQAQPMYSLESLCMRCGEQGTTRLLLTRVPHFRELVVMAFECPHCGESNNEVQFAGALQPKGVRMRLSVPARDRAALDRQVVKSDTASIRVPELALDIPIEAQRGSLSTVEGVLRRAREELSLLQPERRAAAPETAAKIDEFLKKLELCCDGSSPFTLVLDDPSGNSFIESPGAPAKDALLEIEHYERNAEDNEKLGYSTGQAQEGTEATGGQGDGDGPGVSNVYVPAGTVQAVPHGAVGAPTVRNAIASGCTPEEAQSLLRYSAPEEVMVFPAHCSACGAPSETRMFVTNIPYFKEVVIMSTSCDACGFKSSEVKPGGGVSARGRRICLLVTSLSDLTRDIIKSETASVAIPELELELEPGTLGGKVTTVEGLVTAIRESLASVFPFQVGDSAAQWERSKWQALQAQLQELLEVKRSWHLIVDDALANSFVAPGKGESMADDEQLEVEEYDRSWEQDEELGLHDMHTEDAGTAAQGNNYVVSAEDNQKPEPQL